jgi:hypothetical protein
MRNLHQKTTAAALVALALCLLLVTAVSAAVVVVLDTFTGSSIGGFFSIDSSSWVAQSFLTDETENVVTRVDVNLHQGVPGMVWVEIWSATGTGDSMVPGSLVDTVGSVNANSLTADADALVTFDTLSISLNTETFYFLVVRGENTDGVFFWTVKSCESNCNPENFTSYIATTYDGSWTNYGENFPGRAIISMGNAPTAVELSGFNARAAAPWAGLGLGAALLLGAAAVVVRRRK